MYRKLNVSILMLILPVMALSYPTDTGKPVKVITDASIGALNFWSSDTVYNIQGFCFVEDGEVLIIEEGTIIKGSEGVGSAASALIVSRGGKIFAEGSPTKPIIFTSIVDLVDDPGDIDLTDPIDSRGRWGGVIILGKARVNTATPFDNGIEGIPTTELRARYGGSDDDDNSGVFSYVSIRHAGSEIGASNEINGLTMGGLGRATVISHVEVFYNFDDGFEWFGGTVNADHLVAAFCGDDCFDYDEGWRGQVQFAFGIMDAVSGDNGGEHDGGTVPEDGTPFCTPLFSNATYIGRGASAGGQRAFTIRDNAGGAYFNSIFYDHGTFGLTVEVSGTEPTDSEDRMLQGQLQFDNNVWYSFGNGNTASAICNGVAFIQNELFTSGLNLIGDPNFASISRTNDNNLDPRPLNLAGIGWSGWINPIDPANNYNPPPPATGYPTAISVSWNNMDSVHYAGAFDPNGELWIYHWSALDQYGFLSGSGSPVDPWSCTADTTNDGSLKPVFVVDTGVLASDTTYWGADTVWLMSGRTFVDSGQVLIIGPGTIIKGKEGNPPSGASVLIVARGGKIYANGNCDCPIVFTAESDLVVDPDDLDFNDPGSIRGRWGGVIMLGKAKVNTATPNDNGIEGIPTSELRARYGGSDDNDNSGVFKYVSIRHAGQEIGASNEINGLTMGGVGRNTAIHHVEVFYNFDDGFEWFGGTVNSHHLVAAFCGDDCFDYDEGWRGQNQFLFGVMETTIGDNAGEHDGGTVPEDGSPFATPLFSNATYLGRGAPNGGQRVFTIRDNAGGGYFNSIFYDHGTFGLTVEVSGTEPTDSEDRLLQGQLQFDNNLWFSFGNGNTPAAICNNVTFIQSELFTSGLNYAQNPGIQINSRTRGATGIDPRPRSLAATSWTGWKSPLNPGNNFNPPTPATGYPSAIDVSWSAMDSVPYPGAFDPNKNLDESWVYGWTALWEDGWLSELDPQCCVGLRGDPNGDGAEANVLDLTFIVDRIFRGGPPPACLAEGDLNSDGTSTNVLDLTFCVDRIFRGGPLPGTCAARIAAYEAEPQYKGNMTATVNDGRTVISMEMPEDLNAVQIELSGTGIESNAVSKLSPEVELLTLAEGSNLRVGLIDLQGLEVIKKGLQTLIELDGEYRIESVVASDMNHRGVVPTINQAAKESSLPVSYELEQNYPNPFNPSTEISYSLPERALVNLEIYNVLGQRVRTLVNQEMEAGVHTVTWDGRDSYGSTVASGLYMYRMQTGRFSESRKMMLLK